MFSVETSVFLLGLRGWPVPPGWSTRVLNFLCPNSTHTVLEPFPARWASTLVLLNVVRDFTQTWWRSEGAVSEQEVAAEPTDHFNMKQNLTVTVFTFMFRFMFRFTFTFMFMLLLRKWQEWTTSSHWFSLFTSRTVRIWCLLWWTVIKSGDQRRLSVQVDQVGRLIHDRNRRGRVRGRGSVGFHFSETVWGASQQDGGPANKHLQQLWRTYFY